MNEDDGRDNGSDAPLTHPIVREKQTPLQSRNVNHPSSADHPQAPSSNQTYKPTPSDLPPSMRCRLLCGPLTVHPSPLPYVPASQPPPTTAQSTAPSVSGAGGAVLPMYLSELSSLLQATRHLFLPPRTLRASIQEMSHNHNTAELVSGRFLPVPIGLPVVVGDRLPLNRTVASDDVTKDDNC